MKIKKPVVSLKFNSNNELVHVEFPAEMLRNWIDSLKIKPEQKFCIECGAKLTETATPQNVNKPIESEDAKQFYELGEDYYYGRNGKDEDATEATKWYFKAAELGYAPAQYSLGYCLNNGDGIEEDEEEAWEWVEKAAKQEEAKVAETAETEEILEPQAEEQVSEEAAKIEELEKGANRQSNQLNVLVSKTCSHSFVLSVCKYNTVVTVSNYVAILKPICLLGFECIKSSVGVC